MKTKCACCEKTGQLGNGIRYTKVVENNKTISIPLCSRCQVDIETKEMNTLDEKGQATNDT